MAQLEQLAGGVVGGAPDVVTGHPVGHRAMHDGQMQSLSGGNSGMAPLVQVTDSGLSRRNWL